MASADVVGFAIMGLSALWGLFGGFLSLVLGFASWAGAIWATLRFYPLVVPYLAPYTDGTGVTTAIAIALCFVVSLVTCSFVARRLAGGVRGSVLAGLDRLLGLVLGAGIGFGVLVVGFVGLRAVFGPIVILESRHSVLAPSIEAAATYLEEFLPVAAPSGLAPFLPKGHEAVL